MMVLMVLLAIVVRPPDTFLPRSFYRFRVTVSLTGCWCCCLQVALAFEHPLDPTDQEIEDLLTTVLGSEEPPVPEPGWFS